MMPPLPKKKHTKSRKKLAYKKYTVTNMTVVECIECGNWRLRHRACTECGTYLGRKVASLDTEKS